MKDDQSTESVDVMLVIRFRPQIRNETVQGDAAIDHDGLAMLSVEKSWHQ